MSKEQQEIWELPGWEKNSLMTSAFAIAEIWENIRIGVKALIRRNDAGIIVYCVMTGM